ncbi:PMP-22/EMP/MP20/Claudin tight junction [Schistosoma japonicum]|nr:PMP-22/EMP/MP20/Claudin tight junction [Schistosoma japonicum]
MRIKHRIKHSPFSECRYRTAYISTYAAFVFLLISFVTPYWLQSWPRLHTPFLRLGLWEFCVNGFVQRLDPNMISYYGCWWILSPYMRNIFTDLVPFILLFISVVIFGINYQNEVWMPYPTLNWPSWSYGFAILSGFSSLLSAISFGLFNKELRRDIQSLVLDFPMSTNVKTRRRWKLIKRHWPEDVVPVRQSTKDEKSMFHSVQKYPSHSDLEVPPSMEKFSEYSYSETSGDNLVHGDRKTKSYHGSNRQDSDV